MKQSLYVSHRLSKLYSSLTSRQATSTVPVPAGFISIDTTNGEESIGQAPSKRTTKRQPNAVVPRANRGKKPANPPGNCVSSQIYPVAVTCTDTFQLYLTETLILIEPTSTKTLQGPTTTALSTITSTSVSIVLPNDASATLSFEVTSTQYTTIFTTTELVLTTTSTQTFTSTTTLYDACATSNILGPETSKDMYPEDNYYTDSSASLFSPSADSPYACCVACLNTANCYYAAYYYDADAVALGNCNIVVGDSCPAGQPIEGHFYTTAEPIAFEVSYSNGLCGSIGDGGEN